MVGDPGVGKTRLADEFAATASGACAFIQIRCAVEGAVALAPVVEVLRTRDLEAEFPLTVPERDRILRELTGMTAGVAGSVEETFWALRRFVEVLACDVDRWSSSSTTSSGRTPCCSTSSSTLPNGCARRRS